MIDYKTWALDLCSLLDEIEMRNEDEDLEELLRYRFEIAEGHGFIVTFEDHAQIGHA
jgi:hypothetical protein